MSVYPSTAAPNSVYIHIPFCTHKCHYCDFNSYELQGQPVMDYLRALDREMELTVHNMPHERIDTIFVGGGTPTVLNPEQMDVFLQSVRKHFPSDPGRVEFTMEANPGTTDADKLAVMKEGGVNRISFGVQSFDNALLHRIGRIHSTDEVYRSLELARAAGFTNLSIDLMFGLPGQTLEILEGSVDEALRQNLQHYSIYGLKVEENTLFHTLYQKNRLPLPSEDDEVAMYNLIMSKLAKAGYEQYEISNFAKPGFSSRHNTAYWHNQSYYGLGAGAHGYARATRHMNVRGVAEYISAAHKGLPRAEEINISMEEAKEDFMMVGLRMLHGVSNIAYMKQFGERMESSFGKPLSALCAKGLLEQADDGYRLTQAGILLGNEVFGEFIGVLV
jgi:putative oxygen-independent coproporphyrinogen III oxidase